MKYDDIIYILPLLSVAIGAIVLMVLSPIKSFSINRLSWVASFFLIIAFLTNALNFGLIYSVTPFSSIFSSMIVVDTFAGYFSSIIMAGGIVTKRRTNKNSLIP